MSSVVQGPGTSIWAGVIGQPEAVRVLTAAAPDPAHAYLFVGPEGSTKGRAARSFAALLLDPSGDPDGRVARLVHAGEHVDVVEIRRVGARISAEQAQEIVQRASRSPRESDRKVLILEEFHLIDEVAAAMLLKVVEEPPPSTTFVILADQLPNELVTIASRCVRVPFRPLDDAEIEAALVAEGADPARARLAARAAGHSIDRARVLVTDPDVEHRRATFAGIPRRLDGSGHVVAVIVEEVLGLIDRSLEPLKQRHADEREQLEARVAALGERGSGRKALEDRHKREVRRYRTDELRAGLAAIASTYRDVLVDHADTRRPEAFVHAVERIHEAIEALDLNVNEALLLQALLLELPSC